jgi:hypothetical protein
MGSVVLYPERGVTRHYMDNKRSKDYSNHDDPGADVDTGKRPKQSVNYGTDVEGIRGRPRSVVPSGSEVSLEQMVKECGLTLINGRVHS